MHEEDFGRDIKIRTYATITYMSFLFSNSEEEAHMYWSTIFDLDSVVNEH